MEAIDKWLRMQAVMQGLCGPYDIPKIEAIPPKGMAPSDKRKCKLKEEHEYPIKGLKIIAHSKKDAIKKYKHLKA